MGEAAVVDDSARGSVLRIGSDACIRIDEPKRMGISGAMTAACWAKVTRTCEADQTFVGKGQGGSCWWLGRTDSAQACIAMDIVLPTGSERRMRISGAEKIDDGTWHHLVGTFDGTTMTIYVDGVRDNSIAGLWGHIHTDTEPLYIGESPLARKERWDGLTDDVRIYSYALSSEEVKMLYEGKEPPREKHGE
jgi:hypothetical protein